VESLEIADREVYLVLNESWLLFTQQSQAMWAATQHAVRIRVLPAAGLRVVAFIDCLAEALNSLLT
jgi:hypothetical protein